MRSPDPDPDPDPLDLDRSFNSIEVPSSSPLMTISGICATYPFSDTGQAHPDDFLRPIGVTDHFGSNHRRMGRGCHAAGMRTDTPYSATITFNACRIVPVGSGLSVTTP